MNYIEGMLIEISLLGNNVEQILSKAIERHNSFLKLPATICELSDKDFGHLTMEEISALEEKHHIQIYVLPSVLIHHIIIGTGYESKSNFEKEWKNAG